MSTEALVVHRIPGRCRLRLPHMRGDANFFERLRQELAEQAPGTRVRFNAATGSVLMTGGGVSSLEDLQRFGRERGWFELSLDESGEGAPHAATVLRANFSSEEARRYLTFAFLALAILQVARGQVLVPATSLLWYAFDMSTWHARSA